MSTVGILEASKELGLSTKTIRTYLKNNKLSGKLIDGKYQISLESIRNLKEASKGRIERKASNFQVQPPVQMVTVNLEHYEGLITRKMQLEYKLHEWESKEQKLLEYQNTNTHLTDENNQLKVELEKVKNQLRQEQEKGLFKRISDKIFSTPTVQQ